MNERIKALKIQCWEPRQYGPAWFNSTKFAELIVKECADIAWVATQIPSNKTVANQIRAQFGIKEVE